MNRGNRDTNPIDRLVARYLRSEQERVNGEVFLQRLKERRERKIRIVRRVRLAAGAAAVLLVGAGGLVVLLRAPKAGLPRQANGDLVALTRCRRAVQEELGAAIEGARGVGSAALSAGRAQLADLPRPPAAALRVPESIESALRRFTPLEDGDLLPEESEQ